VIDCCLMPSEQLSAIQWWEHGYIWNNDNCFIVNILNVVYAIIIFSPIHNKQNKPRTICIIDKKQTCPM